MESDGKNVVIREVFLLLWSLGAFADASMYFWDFKNYFCNWLFLDYAIFVHIFFGMYTKIWLEWANELSSSILIFDNEIFQVEENELMKCYHSYLFCWLISFGLSLNKKIEKFLNLFRSF